MKGLNKVMLIGLLGSNPEIKYTPSGTAIANIRLATAENKKGQDGKWEEVTEWHSVVLWGKSAQHAAEWLKKGSKVYIEGKLHTRSWDKDGEKRYATEIIGSYFLSLDPPPAGKSNQNNQQQRNYDDDLWA